MAEVNKINLKALKANYMKKPKEDKIISESINQNTDNKYINNSNINSLSTISSNKEKKIKTQIKNNKTTDKELFLKYESFFKRQEEKIQKKLHSNTSGRSIRKKMIISIFAMVLLLVPAYFIYLGSNLESIKASISGIQKIKQPLKKTKDTTSGINLKKTKNVKDILIKEEILKEDEKFNAGGYIFDIKTETNTSGKKVYIYNSKRYNYKVELRKGLENEIKILKRKKLIKLLLEETKIKK